MDPPVAKRTVMSKRWQALGIGLVAVSIGTIPALAAKLKDPLSPLTSSKGTILCFRRDYTPDHLAQHPKQTTKSILLAFRAQGLVNIVLTPRNGMAKRVAASCDWREGAGIDTSDRKMIPNFSKPAGFDCIVTVGDSAEEGGYLLIDPAQDGNSLTLFLQSPITVDTGKPGKSKGYNLTLGTEDLTFRLTRIEPKACEPFKAAKE